MVYAFHVWSFSPPAGDPLGESAGATNNGTDRCAAARRELQRHDARGLQLDQWLADLSRRPFARWEPPGSDAHARPAQALQAQVVAHAQRCGGWHTRGG